MKPEFHFLQANENEKKSDSNNSTTSCNSNNDINYLIIKHVFLINGECLVIQLWTLIDGKKQKKISAKEGSNPIRREEKEGTTLLLTLLVSSNNWEQRGDECEEDVLKRLEQICLFNNKKSLDNVNSIHIDNNDDSNINDNDSCNLHDVNKSTYSNNICFHKDNYASVLILLPNRNKEVEN